MSSFQGVGIEGSTVYTEVSSFQGVGIEEFHCIHRSVLISGGWNRGVSLYTVVSSLQRVGIEGIQRCGWNGEVTL